MEKNVIFIKGAKEHNLKDLDLEIPRDTLRDAAVIEVEIVENFLQSNLDLHGRFAFLRAPPPRAARLTRLGPDTLPRARRRRKESAGRLTGTRPDAIGSSGDPGLSTGPR